MTSIIHPSIDIESRKVIFFEDVELLLVFTKNISHKGAILKIPLGRKIVFEILFAFRHDIVTYKDKECIANTTF